MYPKLQIACVWVQIIAFCLRQWEKFLLLPSTVVSPIGKEIIVVSIMLESYKKKGKKEKGG
jgi:hypothetical protein